jgi:uncharacterized protein (UPF0335 family)
MEGSYHIDTALRGFVERIVNLHQDRDAVNGDIRELYGELKDAGFNVTIVRGMVKEHRMDAEARDSLYQLQNEYRIKLGMLAGTPLGNAALEAEAIELGETMRKPKLFAKQPLHEGPKRRGRPRKPDRTAEALDRARSFLGDDDILETHGSA